MWVWDWPFGLVMAYVAMRVRVSVAHSASVHGRARARGSGIGANQCVVFLETVPQPQAQRGGQRAQASAQTGHSVGSRSANFFLRRTKKKHIYLNKNRNRAQLPSVTA